MAKHIITFVSCLFLISFTNITLLNAQWEPCNKGLHGMPGDISGSHGAGCFVVDGSIIFGGIDEGIYMTTDNGDNWIAKNNGLKMTLMGTDVTVSSLVINGNNIFAGAFSDGIYLSSDKGENWVRKSNGLPFFVIGFDTIFSAGVNALIISGKDIFAGTEEGVYFSTDNGENWISRTNGLPEFYSNKRDIYSMAIIENNIYAGTRYGVYMTSDNGENWYPKNKGMENWDIYTIAIKGNNIYAGSWYGLFLSTNDGVDWNKIGVVDSTIVDVSIVQENYIIAGGHGLYLSKDNGSSWTAINSGLTYLGETCAIINGDYIFAGTDAEGIFRAKLSDLGITDVKETEQKKENTIFPNPASDEFRLRFHAPNETEMQLNIFDLLGNKVLSRTEQATEGTNEKNINCEKLPQGYYYVKINVNEIVQTIPLVIVK